MFNWLADGKLLVPDLKNQVVSAILLANGKKVKTFSASNGLTISIPATAPDVIESVIKIEVKGKVGNNTTHEPKKEIKSGALD